MGENEQGGMLRTVVVIGIVAMVAVAVIFGITNLKASMNKNTATAVYNVDKVPKPYQFENNGDIQFDRYPVSEWYGPHYDIPVTENIKPGYWRELHATIAPETDATVLVDINAYDLDNPVPQSGPRSGNDVDEYSKREVKMYEDGKLVQDMGAGNIKANLKAGHTYQLLVKYHNNLPRTIYDVKPGDYPTRLVIGAPDDSAEKVKVTDLEAATYKMP